MSVTGAEKKACLVIAHYNYTLRFRSCGLSEGKGSALDSLRTLSQDPA